MAKTARELFLEACEIAAGEARESYLNRECGDDQDLRHQVEALIVADQRPLEFIQRLDQGEPTHVDSSLPQSVDRYLLIRPLGEGGMGTVWLAEQQQPVRRKVALKLIKAGMDSQSVIERFESERQALAIMDHPNIAKVFDAGTTPSGRPFFVMELVDGQPITKYCDQRRLNTDQRLQLFLQVCEAVQHAHQKGIIHRDLKPSNVLVAESDGRPLPKIIDFGVAKAISNSLTDKTGFTEIGQLVGTLEYMSPEQARLVPVDVDTRSDIYSLGVLLYELLTGSTPVERKSFAKAALDEVLRVIREVEPPCPSAKLSSSDNLPSLAANRAVDPHRLTRTIRGELDSVVMKALDKDRDRRYPTASALAADLGHFLRHEAVTARPPSVAYRASKFVRRNRMLVLATSAVFLALIAGLLTAALGWQRAFRAELAATNARDIAEKRLALVDHGNELLASIFDDLDPQSEKADSKPLRAVLGDRLLTAAQELETTSLGDAQAMARLQYRLAESLLHLGFPDQAGRIAKSLQDRLEKEVGLENREVLQYINLRANCLQSAGDYEQALKLFEQVLESRSRLFGKSNTETLATINSIGVVLRSLGRHADAVAQFEQSLLLRRELFGDEDLKTIASQNMLALALIDVDQVDRAFSLLEQVIEVRTRELGKLHPDTRTSISALAGAYFAKGQFEQAARWFEEIVQISRDTLGTDDPETLRNTMNLCVSWQRLGKAELAVPMLETVVKGFTSRLGQEHPSTLTAMNSLAEGYRTLGKSEQALSLLEQTLKLQQKTLGDRHPSTLVTMNNVALGRLGLNQFEEAIALMRVVLETRREVSGGDHHATLAAITNLARCYRTAGKYELAVPLYKESLEKFEATLGLDHPSTLVTLASLGQSYLEAKQLDDALPVIEQVYHRATQRADGIPASLTDLPKMLAALYEKLDRSEEAEVVLSSTLTAYQTRFGRLATSTRKIMSELASLLFRRMKYVEAEQLAKTAWEMGLDQAPEYWETHYLQCLLGASLMRQGHTDRAEQLLKEGERNLKARIEQIPPPRESRLKQIADWIAENEQAGKTQ
jgi:serine/threonine protein kinase/tetratricopeptide (TPR) repeat protein